MKERGFEGGKRKPKIESLYNNPVHQKIVRRIRVNYSSKISNIYRLYNNVALLPGTG
jgi:hypothetical protein